MTQAATFLLGAGLGLLAMATVIAPVAVAIVRKIFGAALIALAGILILIAAIVAVAGSAHAAEIDSYTVVHCFRLPYPYDASCHEGRFRVDRQSCEDEVTLFNNRVGPTGYATCKR